MNQLLNCFKAYDVRGRLPDELNSDIAYRIGRAFAQYLQAKRVIVGRDMRLSSNELADALIKGLQESGVDVYDIGLCGTEEVYFATFAYTDNSAIMDGGIMITASHNPKDYNGMKLVREQSRPISGDTGLRDIQRLAELNQFAAPATQKGQLIAINIAEAYTQHLLSYIDINHLVPLKIVVNAGNGVAGHVIDNLEVFLKDNIQFIKLHHEPDGHFPNGIPARILLFQRSALNINKDAPASSPEVTGRWSVSLCVQRGALER